MSLFNRELQSGSVGLEVIELQRYLNEIGYGNFKSTGFFGEKTLGSLMELQVDNHISPASGRFGPRTKALINSGKLNLDREIIYKNARSLLGQDLTPDDNIPDEVDCSETICVILKESGFDIGIIPFTGDLYRKLLKDPSWRRVSKPLRGDLIISPTGYGNSSISGHVGLVGMNEKIMSNSSASGKFEENYTIGSWYKRYRDWGKLPTIFFRKIGV